MFRRKDPLRKIERDLYLASRTVGDFRAAQHGRLGQRLVRRRLMRGLIGPALSRLFRNV
jgi:hypothetical protein